MELDCKDNFEWRWWMGAGQGSFTNHLENNIENPNCHGEGP